MPSFVETQSSDGQTGTGVRQPRSGQDSPAERIDVPAFIVTNEMSDPSIRRRLPSHETEARGIVTAADGAATDVGTLAFSGNRRVTTVVEIERRKRTNQQRSQVLQQWEGTVEEVSSDSFGARIRNLSVDGAPEEWATLLLDEISDDERPLVMPGAVFYWSIGYLIEPYGQRRTASTIYFRRLPAWSAQDHVRAQLVADSYCDVFSNDLSERSTGS
jgi:hypothetical protein